MQFTCIVLLTVHIVISSLCLNKIQTIIVVVQTVEHESEFFLVGAQILGEFLKVQLSIMIGITHAHNLQE